MNYTATQFWGCALAYLSGLPAQTAFGAPHACTATVVPTAAHLNETAALYAADPAAARRMVNFTYALAATLPVHARLSFPRVEADSPLRALYPDRAALEPLLAVLDQLTGLQAGCDALPGGSFQLVEAAGDLLHFTRTGPTEVLDAVFNRGEHILLAEIDGKSVAVNPCGFTLTVREHGHNADHSYFDFK